MSNEAFGNTFDQAITLLAQNDEGLYGEQTGEQLVSQKPIALSNPYRQNQEEVDQRQREDEEFAKPSSQRTGRNGKK